MEEYEFAPTPAMDAYLESLEPQARKVARSELIGIHNGVMKARGGTDVYELRVDPNKPLKAAAIIETVDNILGGRDIVRDARLRECLRGDWQDAQEVGEALNLKFIGDRALVAYRGRALNYSHKRQEDLGVRKGFGES